MSALGASTNVDAFFVIRILRLSLPFGHNMFSAAYCSCRQMGAVKILSQIDLAVLGPVLF